MTILKQYDILTAGCQPWNKDVAATKGKCFAYAATLAVYIYKYKRKAKTFLLHSVVAQFKNTVTCVSWHPKNNDFLGIASSDPIILVWSISQRIAIAILGSCLAIPKHICWHGDEYDAILYLEEKGPVYMWKSFLNKMENQSWKSVQMKEIPTFLSEVTIVRWHPTVAGKLAFGHNNGTISLYVQGRKAVRHMSVVTDDDKTACSVTALEWDSLSGNYLLAVTGYQRISLYDCNEQISVIMTYSLPSRAINVQAVSWVPSAPGMFLTGDKESGILRLWSVSQTSPLESIRLKETGVQALCVLGPLENDADEGRTSTNDKTYCSPKNKVVLLFTDGGVGVYDIFQRKWNFLKEMGHVETIFDCQFNPENCDLLATASFDGTMKVWNLATMTPEYTSPEDESIIYGISWAPKNLDCIAAATSKKGVLIWDIKKGVVSKRLPHKDEKGNMTCFYCVAWNQKDARKIAAGGTNGQCLIFQVDGPLLYSFDHPATVYGCDWHPSNESILATACDDHEVRIYCVTTGIVQPLKVLSGHTGKVFRVKWSPLRDSFLCSTSDDCTLRVWDYSTATNVRTLTGHTQNVRGLLWCYELAHIIISGSWDSTIRVWDLRDGQCITIIQDHAADVYGLACHPQRPFLLASSSRDSTIRFWSMHSLVSTAYAQSLIGREWTEIFATPVDYNRNSLDQPLLCGPLSTKLYGILCKLGKEKEQVTQVPLLLSQLFCASPVISNLYDLLCLARNQDVSSLSPAYISGIQHTNHIAKFQMSKAQQLEMVKTSRFGSGGIGAPTREDSLNQAAEVYLLMGNLHKYCELKAELGEWKEALVVAPGVSHSYWQLLTKRYAKTLLQRNSLQSIPHLVASNSKKETVHILQNNGQLQEALTVAASEWRIAQIFQCINNPDDITTGDGKSLLEESVDNLADAMLNEGKPIHAACYYFSINDIHGAMKILIRGHEIETAVSVGKMEQVSDGLMQVAAKYLAWKCTKSDNWDLAMDALLLLYDKSEKNIAQLCIHCPLALPEKNLLLNKAGLPSVDESLSYAQEAEKDNNLLQSIKYYLLSHEPETGLKMGLNVVRGIMCGVDWKLVEVWEVIKMLAHTRTEVLQSESCIKLVNELQLYSAYAGTLEAIHRNFKPIVQPLFLHTRKCLQKLPTITLPLTEEQLMSELHVWKTFQKGITLTEEQQQTFDDLMNRLQDFQCDGETGETLVAGSHLPRHSDQHHSYLTAKAIKGAVFFLEDGKSAISLNDALMWAKVNPFSPLETNQLINPF